MRYKGFSRVTLFPAVAYRFTDYSPFGYLAYKLTHILSAFLVLIHIAFICVHAFDMGMTNASTIIGLILVLLQCLIGLYGIYLPHFSALVVYAFFGYISSLLMVFGGYRKWAVIPFTGAFYTSVLCYMIWTLAGFPEVEFCGVLLLSGNKVIAAKPLTLSQTASGSCKK